MVPRQTYLHTGVEEDVRLLHKFAPSANFRPSLGSMSSHHWDDDGTSSPSSSGGKHAASDEGKAPVSTDDEDEIDTKNNDRGESNANTEDDHHNNQSTTDGTTLDSPYPICWFEDEETGTPIRWHLFVGVLYDLFRLRRCLDSSSNNNDDGDDDRQYPMDHPLPWKIRVHFTSYPTSLLPLHRDGDDPHSTASSSTSPSSSSIRNRRDTNDGLLLTLSKAYLNSLKTALYVQHHSNRVSRRCMTKDSDLDLWDSIVSNNWCLYRQVCEEFDGEAAVGQQEDDGECDGGNDARDLHNVPVRIFVDGRPAITRPCRPYRDVVESRVGDELLQENDKCGDELSQRRKMMTVGEVLMEWLPHLFTSVSDEAKGNKSQFVDNCRWCIQGLQVPWDSPIANLWRGLCHPDRFLYIIVITRDDTL